MCVKKLNCLRQLNVDMLCGMTNDDVFVLVYTFTNTLARHRSYIELEGEGVTTLLWATRQSLEVQLKNRKIRVALS